MPALAKFIPDILEKKIVAAAADGSEMAWVLQTTKEGTTEWTPRLTHATG